MTNLETALIALLIVSTSAFAINLAIMEKEAREVVKLLDELLEYKRDTAVSATFQSDKR